MFLGWGERGHVASPHAAHSRRAPRGDKLCPVGSSHFQREPEAVQGRPGAHTQPSGPYGQSPLRLGSPRSLLGLVGVQHGKLGRSPLLCPLQGGGGPQPPPVEGVLGHAVSPGCVNPAGTQASSCCVACPSRPGQQGSSPCPPGRTRSSQRTGVSLGWEVGGRTAAPGVGFSVASSPAGAGQAGAWEAGWSCPLPATSGTTALRGAGGRGGLAGHRALLPVPQATALLDTGTAVRALVEAGWSLQRRV